MKNERGQTLILVALALVALIGLTALAIDGGNAFSVRRQAQNASDAAALAAAYASVQGNDSDAAAQAAAKANNFTNGGRTSVVLVTAAVPASECPGGVGGMDYTVTINTVSDTWFGGIVGISEIQNNVDATARRCNFHYQPFFWGNAVVGLNPNPSISFDGTGTAGWKVTGGGIFANGNVDWGSKSCGESTVPSVTAVGEANCTPSSGSGGPSSVNENATGSAVKYPEDAKKMMPPDACANGVGKPDPYTNPKKGDTYDFKNNVFCITDLDKYDGTNINLENATLYVKDETIALNFSGGGGFSGTPTRSGTYAGYFMIVHMFDGVTCTKKNGNPEIVFTGNGLSDIQGTIMAPSACIDVRGNSASNTMKSMIIGHTILSMGTADVKVNYSSDENAKRAIPPTIELLK